MTADTSLSMVAEHINQGINTATQGTWSIVQYAWNMSWREWLVWLCLILLLFGITIFIAVLISLGQVFLGGHGEETPQTDQGTGIDISSLTDDEITILTDALISCGLPVNNNIETRTWISVKSDRGVMKGAFNSVVLYINDECKTTRAIARWRLTIGR